MIHGYSLPLFVDLQILLLVLEVGKAMLVVSSFQAYGLFPSSQIVWMCRQMSLNSQSMPRETNIDCVRKGGYEGAQILWNLRPDSDCCDWLLNP